MPDKGWQRRFDKPIPLPKGKKLVTLRDAAEYITKLPKAEHDAEEWRAAREALARYSASGLLSAASDDSQLGCPGQRRRPCSNKSAHNTSRITNRQTISRDVFSHHTTRADNGVVSNEKAGKDYHARADPHVIFDDNWCGRRRHLTLFHAMLVPVHDKRVMTQQTVAADLDLFVCRNRRAVVNERMIAYRDASTFVRDEFDRDDVAY
jgi:hypothetical protein